MTASSKPCSMLTPKLADEPVKAPKKASSEPHLELLAVLLPPPVSLLHAAAPAISPITATPPMARARTCLKVGTLLHTEPTEPQPADWHLRTPPATPRPSWGGTLSHDPAP